MTIWSEIDEPVLRWLFSQPQQSIRPPTWRLEVRPPAAFEELPGLDDRQVDEALMRLQSYGLVDGNRSPTRAFSEWSGLRVTAQGLMVLGEWPDLDAITQAGGVRAVLSTLAEQATDPAERKALRRAVGVMSQLGDGIIGNVAGGVAGEAAPGAEET